MAYKGSRGWTRDRYCVTHSSAASARDSGNRRPLGAVPSHAITWPRVPPNHGLGEESCLFCLVGLSSLLLGRPCRTCVTRGLLALAGPQPPSALFKVGTPTFDPLPSTCVKASKFTPLVRSFQLLSWKDEVCVPVPEPPQTPITNASDQLRDMSRCEVILGRPLGTDSLITNDVTRLGSVPTPYY